MNKPNYEKISFNCPGSPNCVSSKASDEAHLIEGIKFSGDFEKAVEKICNVIKSFPRAEIIFKSDTMVHAVFKSAIFRFKDDLYVQVNKEKNILEIKSASRVGYSDLGVNRKRVEKIRTLFEEADL